MDIWIIRHGPAGDADPARFPDDSLRPLTEDGAEKTAQAARGLARSADRPSVVFHSPFVRAVQTADRFLRAWARGAERQSTSLLEPDARVDGMVALLLEQPADSVVAVVGHQPHLGRLISALTGTPESAVELKKSSAAHIRLTLENGSEPRGELLALLPPSVLRNLAGD